MKIKLIYIIVLIAFIFLVISAIQNSRETPQNRLESIFIPKAEAHTLKLYKIGASEEQQELVQLAYELEGIDFVYTIEAESGFRTDAIGYNTDGSYDYGACQINSYYHMPILQSGLFVGKNQIYYCADVWKDGQRKGWMPFVGYWSRWKAIPNFIIK